jgi:hypothetical protein
MSLENNNWPQPKWSKVLRKIKKEKMLYKNKASVVV